MSPVSARIRRTTSTASSSSSGLNMPTFGIRGQFPRPPLAKSAIARSIWTSISSLRSGILPGLRSSSGIASRLRFGGGRDVDVSTCPKPCNPSHHCRPASAFPAPLTVAVPAASSFNSCRRLISADMWLPWWHDKTALRRLLDGFGTLSDRTRAANVSQSKRAQQPLGTLNDTLEARRAPWERQATRTPRHRDAEGRDTRTITSTASSPVWPNKGASTGCDHITSRTSLTIAQKPQIVSRIYLALDLGDGIHRVPTRLLMTAAALCMPPADALN